MTFTIATVPTLRDAVGHCYVIAGRESVAQLVEALAVERLQPAVLRSASSGDERADAQTQCLLSHRAAWRLAARHDGWTLVCEGDFVPCLGMGGFPAFWPVDDPHAWGYLYQGSPRLLALTGPRPYLRGGCAPLVAYVINATVARILCDLLDERMALHDPSEHRPVDGWLQGRLVAQGYSAYFPRRHYGEHGGPPHPGQRACGARLAGIHRADNLAGRLHFLPHYSRGSWLRFAAVRAAARLRGLARLATDRRIIDADIYPDDRLTRLRMLGIAVGRLAGCSRDD